MAVRRVIVAIADDHPLYRADRSDRAGARDPRLDGRRPVRPGDRRAGLFLATSACVLVLLGAAVVFLHATVRAEPTQDGATVGGLRYAVNDAWILDPQWRVDASITRGLPAADRKLGRDELLYAVFVGVTNETGRRLPMARPLALRDATNHEYRSVPLGESNRYAYRPHVMAPQSHRPAPWTPAGEDMTAEGLMSVFRIPRSAYDDGRLQLVVHDPAHPDATRALPVL
jgi:hypothetical protein